MKSKIKFLLWFVAALLLWSKILSPLFLESSTGQGLNYSLILDSLGNRLGFFSKEEELKETTLANQGGLEPFKPIRKDNLSPAIILEEGEDGGKILRFHKDLPKEEVLRALSFLQEKEVNLIIEGIKNEDELTKYMRDFQYSWKENKASLDPRESWSSMEWSYIKLQPSKVYLTLDFVLSRDELALVQSEFTRVAEDIKAQTSDSYEQTKLAYEKTVERIQYDFDSLEVQQGPKESWIPRNCYTAITTGKVVCSGYVDYYNGVLDELGIDNRTVVGSYTDENGQDQPHAWTEIRLEDGLFYSDPTFGDGYHSRKVVWEWHHFNDLKDHKIDQ